MKSKTALRTTFFALILSILPRVIYAQSYHGDDSYAPPSPNVFSLSTLANHQVNLNTGTADVKLPITQLSGRKVNVPIFLSYSANGVKVQDIPGNVGLGWTLNAGGNISRVVKNLPDEDANGYCGVNGIGKKADDDYTTEYVNKVADGDWDGEPDLFIFNILGRTGKFIIDAFGNPVLLPHANLRITPGIGPMASADGSWTIVDESGVKYVFGKLTAERENSLLRTKRVINPNPENKNPTIRTEFSYISSWYLSEIVAPDGSDLINFTYANADSVIYQYFTQEQSTEVYYSSPYRQCCGPQCGDDEVFDKVVETVVTNPVELRTINCATGSVNFYSNRSRQDIPGADKLYNIVVRNSRGITIGDYDFVYSYFLADNCTGEYCKRLRLDKIVQQGTSNSSVVLYSLAYNDTNLPSRDSHRIDHWGYFNASTHTSKIPFVHDSGACGGDFPGADRAADSVLSRANILTRIYESTGGYTEFVYAGHTFSADGTTNQVAGGARIRVVKKCENDNDCLSTYYYYNKFTNNQVSSGRILALPQYHFRSAAQSFQVMGYNPPTGFAINQDHLVRVSNSLTDLFGLNGYHISYSNVIERKPGFGYAKYTFTDDELHADEPGETIGFTTSPQGEESSNTFPYVPNTSKSSERGLILSKANYDEDGKLVQSTSYQYDFDLPAYDEIAAVKAAQRTSMVWLDDYYVVGRYYHISKPYVVKQISENLPQVDRAGFAKAVITKTELSYYPVHGSGQTVFARDMLPRRVRKILPDGIAMVTEYKYPADYPYANTPSTTEVQGIKLMIFKGISNIPIEVMEYIDYPSGTDYVTGSQLQLFKEFSAGSAITLPWKTYRANVGMGLPLSSWIWSYSAPQGAGYIFSYNSSLYKLIKTFDSYDSYANPITVSDESGVQTSIAWANNSTTVSSVTRSAGSTVHQKSFDLEPLIGVKSTTDENGIITSYTYDDMSRLKLVKDYSGNIVTRYRYHTINEKLDLPSGNITVTGCEQVGETLTFRASINTNYGLTQYEWDFGDGNTTTTTSGTVYHSYSEADGYVVKVTMKNPEYFGVTTSKVTVGISAALTSIAVCADGITRYDVCGDEPSYTSTCISIDAMANATSAEAESEQSAVLLTEPGGGTTVNPPTLRVFAGLVQDYQWQYKKGSSGSWTNFGNDMQSVVGPPGFGDGTAGTWYVRCIVKDKCAQSITSDTFTLVAYKSSSTCQGY